MIVLRSECTGRRPVHFFRKISVVAAGVCGGDGPRLRIRGGRAAPAAVQRPAVAAQRVADFYRGRNDYPFWLATNAGDAADQLLTLLSSARLDGLDPAKYHVAELQEAVAAARSGKKKRVAEADHALSEAFVSYVADLRQDPGVGLTYVDADPEADAADAACDASDGGDRALAVGLCAHMGWMHPFYAQLREALANHSYSTDQQRDCSRSIWSGCGCCPAGRQRYVLVNAAQQRLYMFEDGKPVDSMVVVVGKPKWPTPMLAAYIRYAALNPYWYVPSDLAGEDVGQYVVKFGLKYLDDYGYEIVSDWTPNPTIIDPKTIDWKGVVDGTVKDIMIRQKPGPKNFMGRMKFMFPNYFGVYLHDNPRRELFLKSARFFSGGCVRLEDAARLGRWLFGHDLDWQSAGTEQPVPLAQPVPVYITYLTAIPDGTSIAYYDDVYGRDAPKLAASDPANRDTASAKP